MYEYVLYFEYHDQGKKQEVFMLKADMIEKLTMRFESINK